MSLLCGQYYRPGYFLCSYLLKLQTSFFKWENIMLEIAHHIWRMNEKLINKGLIIIFVASLFFFAQNVFAARQQNIKPAPKEVERSSL